jgi:hypothetical protein
MNSRQRIECVLNHGIPDRVPLDLGSTPVTGMHVSSVYLLRQALGLDPPGTPVKVVDLMQMLGEIKLDLLDALGADAVPLQSPMTRFGFPADGWKEWTLFDGTPVLVPGAFSTEPEADGSIVIYPQGDRSAPPSARMPRDGFYFDSIIRQEPIDEEKLNPEDNLEEFGVASEADVEFFRTEAERLFRETDKAIIANFGGTSFGNIAVVPGPNLKHPKGIRDVAEWYASHALRPDYIRRVYERQCEIALANLERFRQAVGDRVSAVYVSGTDFGAQNGPFVSPKVYRSLYRPFHKQVNDWIHRNANWRTFIHSCGSVRELLPDFAEAGFDILNPVQCSAACMEPEGLKKDFGKQFVFWGGGVDTQRVLPFASPDEVRAQVRERIRVFGQGGGFVFNPTHNVQARVPVENILAMYEAYRDSAQY